MKPSLQRTVSAWTHVKMSPILKTKLMVISNVYSLLFVVSKNGRRRPVKYMYVIVYLEADSISRHSLRLKDSWPLGSRARKEKKSKRHEQKYKV